jgi:putative ABC transport system ATP-binding protein
MFDEQSMVRLEQVSKAFGDGREVCALREVTVEIKRRERVAVMGPSGSGKSTLLNLICGLDVPSAGRVFVAGAELSRLSDDDSTRLRREKIGMIFQTFNLLPTLSALENVALPLRLQGQSRRAAEHSARELLAATGLRERAAHRPDEMSGGERQRTAIARALIFRPPLLLADEPTGNLDSLTGEDILRLLDQLHQELGMTILMVTHNESTAAHCERQIVLHDGRIVRDYEARPSPASFPGGAEMLAGFRGKQN